MAVLVDTSKYEAVHGKKPRGYGHWEFRIGNKIINLTGMYSICRKEAIKIGNKASNVTRVYLLG